MAGVVVLLEVVCFGQLIKITAYPITMRFTAGTAVTILVSRLKDLLGRTITNLSAAPAGRARTPVSWRPTEG